MREEDYHKMRQVDSRVLHDEHRVDICREEFNELSKAILEADDKIAYYGKKRDLEKRYKQRCLDKVKYLLRQNRVKKHHTKNYQARIIESCYVHEIDLELVPEEYKVSKGYRVNKSLIHAKCRKSGKVPPGVEFRDSKTVSITKI